MAWSWLIEGGNLITVSYDYRLITASCGGQFQWSEEDGAYNGAYNGVSQLADQFDD